MERRIMLRRICRRIIWRRIMLRRIMRRSIGDIIWTWRISDAADAPAGIDAENGAAWAAAPRPIRPAATTMAERVVRISFRLPELDGHDAGWRAPEQRPQTGEPAEWLLKPRKFLGCARRE